jgi:hypothetical protein
MHFWLQHLEFLFQMHQNKALGKSEVLGHDIGVDWMLNMETFNLQ